MGRPVPPAPGAIPHNTGNDGMKRIVGLIAWLVIEGASPAVAWSVEPEKTGMLSFVLENDMFQGSDGHYTNGVRVVWVPRPDASTQEWAIKLARLVPWFPEQGEVRHGYAFGQSMFVPSDITIADPPPGERPYAGWLYGTVGLGVESGKQLDLFAFTLGVVGPASLAAQSQKFVHKVVGTDKPQGWDTQLGNEPGFIATYQRSWRGLATTTFLGNSLDFTPHTGFALGNVFTYGNTGVTMRYGKRLPNDYGPPRIQPGLLGSGSSLRCQISAGTCSPASRGGPLHATSFSTATPSATAAAWTKNPWSATCSSAWYWTGPIFVSVTPTYCARASSEPRRNSTALARSAYR